MRHHPKTTCPGTGTDRPQGGIVRRLAAALAAVGAVPLLAAGAARAQQDPQTVPDLPKSQPDERQSAANPFPRGGGDAQNRGRAVNDIYWGVVDGNRASGVGNTATPLRPNTAGNPTYMRVPNLGVPPPDRILELDGWGYPRGASLNGAYLLAPSVRFPQTAAGLAAGAAAPGNVFAGAFGPSTDTTFTPNQYFRAPAVPRPNVAATQIPEAQKYTWDLGALPIRRTGNGQQTRFQIQVHLPQPPSDDVNVAPNAENRINDARYTVYYYLVERNNAGVIQNVYPKRKTFVISQAGGGFVTLLNDDGNPAFFPLFSNQTPVAALPAQPDLGVPFQGVKLDNTTTNSGDALFVLADTVNLVPSVDNVTATPVATPPHGGRWRAIPPQDANVNGTPTLAQPVPASGPGNTPAIDPPAPAVPTGRLIGGTVGQPKQPQQYQSGNAEVVSPLFNPDYRSDDSIAQNIFGFGNYSHYFVNDPHDPIYGLDATLNGAPGNLGRTPDPTVAFEPWNPSTLFRGPESLIDPRVVENADQVLPPGVSYPPAAGATAAAFPNVPATPPGYPFDETQPPVGLPVFPTTPNRPFARIYDPILTNPNFPGADLPLPVTIDGTVGGQPLLRPATSVDSNNHNIYRQNRYAAYQPDPTQANYNPATPLFSHMQVLMARTEYALDPESGVPFSDKDGTLTLRVGAVYSLDWLTGAPIWRFPDRTYVPGNSRNPYLLRTPGLDGLPVDTPTYDFNSATVDPVNGGRLVQVPGIRQLDKNLDGFITDDEVFVVGTGGNNNAGLFASVTLTAKVAVRGRVQLPQYRYVTATNTANDPEEIATRTRIRFQRPDVDTLALRDAPPGRYFRPGTATTDPFGPVLSSVAYIAAENGVIYAVDAYGNNDNDYFPATDWRNFGTYRPGTTNVLFTFSATSVAQQRNETREQYFRRLKAEIPATGSWGASTPVLAYARDDNDARSTPINPLTEELRLFAGNQNGVLYALDARPDAGNTFDPGTGARTGVQSLPYRAETYRPQTGAAIVGGNLIVQYGPSPVKWWFGTRGAINTPPAVSLMRQNSGGGVSGSPLLRKGVYVTTQEGRVYSIDWEGPVTKGDHSTAVNYGILTNNTLALLQAAATALNDNYQFHNVTPATTLARADLLEGTIRPRWTFPNLYRDISGTDNRVDAPADTAADNPGITPGGVAGARLGEPEAYIGPINSAPVLIDFPWVDPLNTAAPPVHLSFLAFVAPDATTDGTPATSSRLYLLDQVGDRVNFLTNPVVRGTGTAARVFANPRDRFQPKILLSDASPVWTYRFVYDSYNPANSRSDSRDISRRNSPVLTPNTQDPPLNAAELNAISTPNVTGLPGRRTTPTLYFAGIGSLYAIDFDEQTGLFQRYRPSYAETAAITSMPSGDLGAGITIESLFPGAEASRDLLVPTDRVFDGGAGAPAARAALANRRILARTIPLPLTPTQVTTLTITAGPLQNRNTNIGYVAPDGTLTAAPALPTVPERPTNDAPIIRPGIFTYDDTVLRTLNPKALFDLPAPPNPDAPANGDFRFDRSGLYVNQDVNDPLATKEGVLSSSTRIPVAINGGQTDPANRIPNTAYQYPVLFVTDANGYFYEVSSNIEGEDRSRVGTENRTYTMGWPLANYTDTIQFPYTGGAVFGFAQFGPGGSAGVSVVTNAYFSALDPYFRNTARDAAYRASAADPNNPDRFRWYQGNPAYAAAPPLNVPPDGPNGIDNSEPNQTSPTPTHDPGLLGFIQPFANNDDPRPDFKPRPFSPGVRPNYGPDGQPDTAPGGDDVRAEVAPDLHTGQTGFPLDANGRFFDKRYAGLRRAGQPVPNSQNDGFVNPTGAVGADYTPIRDQDPNGTYSVKIRLPGYSYVAGSQGPTDPTLVAGDPASQNNQVPNGARIIRPTAAQVAVGVTATGNIDPNADDINPSAQNVTWIFSGGADGILHAYTPAVPGQASGFAAGTPIVYPFDGSLTGAPKVAIVDRQTFESIRNIGGPTFSNNILDDIAAGSIARRGQRNFYEWGETAYILVFDVLAETFPRDGREFYVAGQPRALIEITNPNTNAVVARVEQSLVTFNGQPVYYNFNIGDASSTRLGVAAYAFQIGNPTQQNPQTPGDLLKVAAQQLDVRRVGQNVQIAQVFDDADVYLSIANPIAVQGFLTNTFTQNGSVLRAGVVKGELRDTANGVGPFHSDSQSTAGNLTARNNVFPKDRVLDFLNSSGGTAPATDDPDKFVAEYHQALTNGNSVQRRDLRRFSGTGPNATFNPRFRTVLRDTTGGDEPQFYFPVITSAHMVGHGQTGSTDTGTNQQNLRILNRSLKRQVADVHVLPAESVLLWRSWPGRVPNAEADVPNYAPGGADPVGNPRATPTGMRYTGEVNRLPWDDPVVEARPWNRSAPTIESSDYANIATNNEAIRVLGAIGDYTAAALPLETTVARTTGPGNIVAHNNTLDNGNNAAVADVTRPSYVLPKQIATAANVKVPKYQPANLAALHSQTSTYIVPSRDDDPTPATPQTTVGLNAGPVQVPRQTGDNAIDRRLLYVFQPGSDVVDTSIRAVTPYGYTTRMVAMVDYDRTGRLTATSAQARVSGINPTARLAVQPAGSVTKAFREFELALGVPVDMSLQVVESVIDVGKLSHGFAMQNGLLGYGQGAAPYQPGFLPSPLVNTAQFGANTPPYNAFQKKFTVQNIGNVNLWNLRATQRKEIPTNPASAGTGFPFLYFGLRSSTVDPLFGILAAGADPNANLPLANVMPQVITSLDRTYDAAWDQYIQTDPTLAPLFAQPSAADPAVNVYTAYYQPLGGRHTLHKPLPNATAPTVLGVPDVPTSKLIVQPSQPGGPTFTQPTNAQTVVGVAVPLGTPTGIYTSKDSPTEFGVFEDHDTNGTYNPIPGVNTGAGLTNGLPTLLPGGPRYSGQDIVHPGNNAILPNGAEGIWRPRRVVTTANGQAYEYLPYTQNFVLKAQVTESSLTGLVPDRALATGTTPGSVITGLLPNVDLFPLVDGNTNVLRPAAALSPAAFRSPDGRLHLFFSRNDRPTTAGGPFAQPGQPFTLYTTALNWSTALGTWVSASQSSPLTNASGNPPSAVANTGKWFGALVPLSPAGVNATQPFVLQVYPEYNGAAGVPAPNGATLFWVNTTATPNGSPVSTIQYGRLNPTTGDPDAGGGGFGQPWLQFFDPSLQRFSPRAVHDSTLGLTFLMYAGGTNGKYSLYYSPRVADNTGYPTDSGGAPLAPSADRTRQEFLLPIPSAFSTVSDPAPVVRNYFIPQPGGTFAPGRVIDVYYTGVSRITQSADIYLTRYRWDATRRQLVPVKLPRVLGERLEAPSRQPVWRSRHISWVRDPDAVNAADPTVDLPVIGVTYTPGTVEVLGQAAGDTPAQAARRQRTRWQYDAATGVLFQTFRRNGAAATETYVYVDTAAGTVRFRGPAAPRANQDVIASYQPQTYRVTRNPAANLTPFAFNEDRLLQPTQPTASGVVQRRATAMNVGRNWVFWQRGATSGQAATLYYAPRRVGVDLKAIPVAQGGLEADNSILLNTPDANGNQIPQVGGVTVGAGVGAVPYEVDFATGKIYVEPQYEGLPVQVTYTATNGGNRTAGGTGEVLLSYIEELSASKAETGMGVPMNNPVNEAQPYAFLDVYQNYAALPTRANGPAPAGDPALSPFRVWLFWTSPRGRLGTQFSAGPGGQAVDAFPGGYDLYWQTLAPWFEPQTFGRLP